MVVENGGKLLCAVLKPCQSIFAAITSFEWKMFPKWANVSQTGNISIAFPELATFHLRKSAKLFDVDPKNLGVNSN